jgi:hypothetical protein
MNRDKKQNYIFRAARILAPRLGAALAVSAILLGIFIHQTRGMIEKNLKTQADLAMRCLQADILNSLDPLIVMVDQAAALARHGSSAAFLEPLLAGMAAINPETYDLYYATLVSRFERGGFFASGTDWVPGDDWDPAARDWFRRARQHEGKIVFSDPYYEDSNEKMMITISKTAAGAEGEVIGVMAADVYIDVLEEMVSSRKITGDGQTVMIDANGRYLTHPDREKIMNGNIFDDLKVSRETIISGDFRVSVAGGEYLCSAPLPFLGVQWYLVSRGSTAGLIEGFRRSLIFISLSVLGLSLAAAFLTVMMNRIISVPFRRLLGAFSRPAGEKDQVINQSAIVTQTSAGMEQIGVNMKQADHAVENQNGSFISRNIILLLFVFSFAVVCGVTLAAISLINFSMRTMEYNIEQRLIAVAKRAAELGPAEELDQYRQAEDMEKASYQTLRRKLRAFAWESNVLYVYFVRREGGKLRYIIDNDYNEATRVGLDTAPIDLEIIPWVKEALLGKTLCSGLGNYNPGWEGIFSAYSPIYGPDGNVAAVCAVDINDAEIVNARRMVTVLTIIQIIAVFAVFISGFICLVRFRQEARSAKKAGEFTREFLARVNKEMGAPIATIAGAAELLLRGEMPARFRERVQDIQNAGQNLFSLLRDVRNTLGAGADHSRAAALFAENAPRESGAAAFFSEPGKQTGRRLFGMRFVPFLFFLSAIFDAAGSRRGYGLHEPYCQNCGTGCREPPSYGGPRRGQFSQSGRA